MILQTKSRKSIEEASAIEFASQPVQAYEGAITWHLVIQEQ